MREIVALDINFYITVETAPEHGYLYWRLFDNQDTVLVCSATHEDSSYTVDDMIDYLLHHCKLFAW